MSTGRPPLTWWTALMRGMLRHVLRWYEQDVAMTQSDGVISAEPRELAQLSTDALRAFRDRERARYEAIKTRATPFNLARGKPAPEQILVANNSSLALMHDAVVYALLTGARDGAAPWRDQHRPIRFLCPSPGYDRHFQICEQYGIEMIPVPLTGAGPDMDEVERLAADPAVKGMWCVPKYSNPTAETYSSETVARLARMDAADDFRLFWDNAYAVHDLTGTTDRLDNVLDACAAVGKADRALVFGSTSKITFAQAGLGMLATSPANMRWFVSRQSTRTIGPDKLNQMRHVLVLRDAAGIAAHMEQQRRLLAPKFAAVQEVFNARLGGSGVAAWTQPRGGNA